MTYATADSSIKNERSFSRYIVHGVCRTQIPGDDLFEFAESPMSSLSPTNNSPSDSGDNVGVGLSNPQLSQGRRMMLDLVNRLHSTGSLFFLYLATVFGRLLILLSSVQVDIDLPQIAVIGSQSAGKSSLIESISGITLPRAAGTCTRYTGLLSMFL